MFRFLKYFLTVVSLLLVIVILSACKYNVYIEGIENFSVNDSNMSLNVCILPSDDFIDKFEYSEGEYFYSDVNEHLLYVAGCEQSIVVLNYEEDVYEQAKEYCFENMVLSEINQFDYKGYTFTENVGLAEAGDDLEDGVNTKYPNRFNMFAYNDAENRLVFMGFYNSPDNHDDNVYLAQSDWGAFLDTYFSKYYDFSS